MIWDFCEICGRRAVYRKESETWKRRCIFCWKQDEGIKLSVSDRYALVLEGQIEELQMKRQMLSRRELTEMVSLCHPDKHSGSETANRVTRKILAIRDVSNDHAR